MASGSQLEEAKKWSDKGFNAYVYGKYQEAIDAYKEAVRLDPIDHTAWYYLGLAQKELKKDEDALKSFQESAHLKKDDPLPWEGMVLVYFRLHRFNEAIDPANQVILLKSDSPRAWTELCMACFGAKKYKEAVDACEMWSLLEFDNYKALAALGMAQSETNHLSDAEASLKAGINLAPRDASSLYQLGLVYSKQGNQTKVSEVYQTLQRLDPSLAEKLRRKTLAR